MSRVLRLLEVRRGRDHVAASCGIDDLQFHATVWYEGVDLDALARDHGEPVLDRLALHIGLFQLNAVASLRPDAIELGSHARHATPRLIELWQTVFRRVWAQWRWEHQLPAYAGPRFVDLPAAAPASGSPGARPARGGSGPLLALCGGG